MKPVYALMINFSLLMLLGFSHARKNPAEDYWKQVVKGQAMPEAIRGRIHDEHASISNDLDDHRFSVDFDTRENAIIYHGRHGGHHKEVMITKSFAVEKEFDADHQEDEDPETNKFMHGF